MESWEIEMPIKQQEQLVDMSVENKRTISPVNTMTSTPGQARGLTPNYLGYES